MFERRPQTGNRKPRLEVSGKLGSKTLYYDQTSCHWQQKVNQITIFFSRESNIIVALRSMMRQVLTSDFQKWFTPCFAA